MINCSMLYLNNRLVAAKNARISVFDHGFLYGDGIYETLRVYKGVVFKIDEHIERLFRSASMIKLVIPKSREAIKKAVRKTVNANGHKEAVVRITVSRGAGPLGLDPDLCPVPTFVIMSHEFRRYPVQYYQKGIRIAVVNTRRNVKSALDPEIKSLNFLNNILAKIEAKDRGVYEALMLNYLGYIAEGTVSNIFFVKDGTLCTPSSGVGLLAGITRGIIIDAAGEVGMKVNEGRFRKESIYDADEVFLSNTTMEAMPVADVDGIKISSPGSVTKLLHRTYRRRVAEYVKREKAVSSKE